MSDRAIQRLRRTATLSFVAVVLGFVATSCQDPTEVVIEVRTNVPYRAGIVTAFTVGPPGDTELADPSTETRDPWGADGFVGSLVLVPKSSKTASVSVKVVMGIRRDTRECIGPAYAGCIVARRKLAYLPNERLRLPMVLYANCENVACDPDSTCSALGQCVSSSIDPSACSASDGCVLPGDPKPGVDAGNDGSPNDGAIDVTAQTDAATDGRGDSTIKDAPSDGSGNPLEIRCGGAICSVSTVCCLDQSGAIGHCAIDDSGCSGTETKMHCDGREDCGADVCCLDDVVGGAARCAPAPCQPKAEVCSSGAGCTGTLVCTSDSGGIAKCKP